MRIIKTKYDLDLLRKHGVVQEEFLNEIESYFKQLHQALGRNINNELMDINEFSLEEHGYVVILEKGDNLRGAPMANIGLNPHGGLMVSFIEYVEKINLDSLTIYKISIMHNNDYMMTLYSQKGSHDREIENFLKEQAVEVDSFDESDSEVPF